MTNKVLLLNPPAAERVSRDYYCGHVAKGNYYWPQTDLLIVSGFLSAAGYELKVLDAIVERMSVEEAHAAVDDFAPDVVVSMVAAIAWSSDAEFLTQVKRRHECLVLVSGDFPRADPPRVIAGNPFIDAVITDFSDCAIVDYIENPHQANLRNLYTRKDTGEFQVGPGKRFEFPLPRHDLFPLRKYHIPQILHHPFTLLITDYGCPYKCSYCYFERIAHKRRDMDNIREELEAIRDLGIREMLLMDPSFGAVRSHSLEVCEVMQQVSDRFSWVSEMRVDSADEEMLRACKAAGCHTIMFGVETPNEEVLKHHAKPQTVVQMEQAFRLCKELGIRTLAHFIVGLPGENADTVKRLIDFSIELDPDIASFNVARPAWNTGMRDEVAEKEWLIDDGVEIANPDYFPIWESPDLPRDEMWRLRNEAIRKFYMRPSYMLRQLFKVRTTYQLRTLFREGWHIMRGKFRGSAPENPALESSSPRRGDDPPGDAPAPAEVPVTIEGPK